LKTISIQVINAKELVLEIMLLNSKEFINSAWNALITNIQMEHALPHARLLFLAKNQQVEKEKHVLSLALLDNICLTTAHVLYNVLHLILQQWNLELAFVLSLVIWINTCTEMDRAYLLVKAALSMSIIVPRISALALANRENICMTMALV
jgi:hypothetical protein